MRYFVFGFLIGLANLIPGVSGGTVAVLTGIYERLVRVVSTLFSLKVTREDLFFLLFVVVGAVAAIFAGSNGMKILLQHHQFVTYAVFFGLVMGSLPSLFRRLKRVLTTPVFLGMALVVIPQLFNIELSIGRSPLLLGFGGAVAASAMVLPGLSGSLILLVLGFYDVVITAISAVNLQVLVPFGIGVVVGIVLFVKLIDFALRRFKDWTDNFIVGLVVGSLYVVYPFGLDTEGNVFLGLTLIVIGALVTALIDRYGTNRRT